MTLDHTAETITKFDSIVSRLKAEDSDDRRWAVYDLEGFDPSMTIDYLIDAVQDEHRAVCEAASEVLEAVPPQICVKKLVPLLGSTRIEVRNIVASIIVKFGDDAVDDLIPAFSYENEDVRKFAADILGLAGSEKAVPALCQAALEDDVENVSVAAVEALGKIGSSKALPTLYKILDERESMKVESVEAIGLIGEKTSASFLEERIDQDEPLVTYAIIDALGNIGEASSLSVLKAYLEKAPRILKEQICGAILKIGRRRSINVLNGDQSGLCETLVNCFDDQQCELADLIGYQLSLNPDFKVMKTFFDNIDKLPSTLIVALINSAKTESKLVDELCKLAEHEDDWVAYTAIEALSNFDRQSVKDTVLNMLREDRGLPAIAAIKTALQLRLDEAKPALEILAKGENEDIREAAIQGLREF